jgi:cytoskeletal protein CcmA (bactofilin family)
MWKKDNLPDPTPEPRMEAAPRRMDPPQPVKATGERATIGRSITISGEVTGDEDLLIQGRVDGSVNLKQHSVTIGPEGEVRASITARVITVEGRVEGNLNAAEQAILRGSALVEGDILAPRVVLEDGARFRGGVDMGETSFEQGSPSAGAAAQPRGQATAAPASGSSAPAGNEKGASSPNDRPQSAGAPAGAARTTAQTSL